MVIFHSYVKLPEGKIHETKIWQPGFTATKKQHETTTSSIDVHAQTSSRRIFHEQKRCPGGSSNEAIGTLPLSLTS